MSERDYIKGREHAFMAVLQLCKTHMTGAKHTEAEALSELSEARQALHCLSRELGCDDWDDDIHLADVIGKTIIPAVRQIVRSGKAKK
jgi:hypothetical protein